MEKTIMISSKDFQEIAALAMQLPHTSLREKVMRRVMSAKTVNIPFEDFPFSEFTLESLVQVLEERKKEQSLVSSKRLRKDPLFDKDQ